PVRTGLRQDDYGASLQRIFRGSLVAALRLDASVTRGIEGGEPPCTARKRRKGKRYEVMVGVHQDQESIVQDPFSPLVQFLDALAGQEHAQGLCVRAVPFVLGHFIGTRIEPENILDTRTLDRLALEEPAPAKHRVRSPQRDELLHE